MFHIVDRPTIPASPLPKVKIDRDVKNHPCVKNSKLVPREHQLRAIQHLERSRGLIAAWQKGSGKTLLAVISSQCFLLSHQTGRVIFVTPVSLQDNIKKEIVAAYGETSVQDPRYSFYTLQKFATTFENISTFPDDCFLIVDEAHNLRAAGGVRADVIMNCATKAVKVLLLTGSLIYNAPCDVANLVSMVKGEFALPGHEKAKPFAEKTDVVCQLAYGNEKEFEDFFKCTVSFYDTARDENYPTFEEKWVEIEMTKSYYEEYKKIEENNSDLFGKHPWAFLGGTRQASNALEECLKCDASVDLIKRKLKGGGGSKTLIYSSFFTYGVELLHERLKLEGIDFVSVTGTMTQKERKASVDAFNADKVAVMFITKAGGEGLDLKGVRTVILMESSWNREVEEQAMFRAVRFGSHKHLPLKKRNVVIYHLVIVKPDGIRGEPGVKPSADEMLKTITEKKILVNGKIIEKLQKLSIEMDEKCELEGTFDKLLKKYGVRREDGDFVRGCVAKLGREFGVGSQGVVEILLRS